MARFLTVLTLATALSGSSFAATRMTYAINGAPMPIEWSSAAFPLRYEIDQRVVEANKDAKAIVDRAFAAWAAIPDADVRFESSGVVASSAGRAANRIGVSMADELF